MQDLGIQFFSQEELRQSRLGDQEGECEAARWRIKGADDSALVRMGEKMGLRRSGLCPLVRKSPSHPRPTCLESLLGADPASCPRSRSQGGMMSSLPAPKR